MPEPEASVPPTGAPAASEPGLSVPSTEALSGSVMSTEIPSASVHEASVPSESVPEASIPEVSVPAASVPTTSVPSALSPTTSVPEIDRESSEGGTPSVLPTMSARPVSVPESGSTAAEQSLIAESEESAESSLSIMSVSLVVAAEMREGYSRDEWGPHNSDLCRGAVGSPDPYTGTQIDTCDIDHVVALREAHESGGWNWQAGMKGQFSQDPDNHVATRACVNRSKGSADIFEWSHTESSSACGGYAVTSAGRCFLARTTVTIKSKWGLSVDQAEADTLTAILAECSEPAEANS